MSYKYITYFKKYYKIGILATAIFFFLLSNKVYSKEPAPVIQPIKEEIIIKKEEITEYLYVDIKGNVNAPGVYKMLKSDRVINVIEKASGITADADLKTVNLSKKLIDEMLIYIPSIDEKNCIIETIEETKGAQLISINSATLKDLMTLPGIGEAKARDIIKYRDEKGNFEKIEDIKNVSGIGDATFNNIKALITV